MTTQHKHGPEKRFVGCILPWVIAAGALVLYLRTLNFWISLDNLDQVAHSSGWVWGPELFSPLFYLVTYPLRWLPLPWIPLGYNLFSVVCGALTLALLARSVTLLPHDRTEAQRLREHSRSALLTIETAWIPPVFAALVCGLQLTFWENTTSGSNSLFELLLLAYVIRCLLEFRIGNSDSWLWRGVLVYGAAMANSWLMFCLLPMFLIALVWIKGFAFFNFRFLFRTFLCGTAGLLFYLLLPLIHVLSADHTYSFWEALKFNLAMDKNALVHFARRVPLNVLVPLVISSFLPVLLMGIRWASNFGDPSRMGSALTRWIFHLAHGALLMFCLWVTFDSKFSPRQLGYPLLALYYFGALSVGYFSGYFLLVFYPVSDRMGRGNSLPPWLHKLSFAAILMLLVLVSVGLLGRNIPQIRTSNGPAIKNYASRLVQNLPARGVILSDDSRKLYLAEGWLTRNDKAKDYLFLDTQLLPAPQYHLFQQKLHPAEWPPMTYVKGTERILAPTLIFLLARLSEKSPLYYLHPTFGYYIEHFDQRPHGLNFELKPYPTNSISGPPLTENEVAENEKFWTICQPDIESLIPWVAAPALTTNAYSRQALLEKLHLPFEPNKTAVQLGGFYSQTLNFWGVQMQRAGKLPEAGRHFQTATALFPDNIAAKSNGEFNRELQAGQRPEIRKPRSLEEELGNYRSWEKVLRDTGPFDDPTHCFGVGLTFAQGNLFREAAQQFERVNALVPDNLFARLWLAKLYAVNRLPEKALELISGIPTSAGALEEAGLHPIDLYQTKATALLVADRPAEADRLLREVVQNNPRDQNMLIMVVQISATFKHYTNALWAIDQLLVLKPDDASALVSKGFFNMQLGNFQEAIPILTRALALQPNNYNAQLYRALAYLNTSKLTEARQDYEGLRANFPNSSEVNSGLAEISLQEKDTNAAIRFIEICLTNTPPGSQAAKAFAERLKSLQPGSP